MKVLFLTITFLYSCLLVSAQENDFYNRLSDAAIELTGSKVKYDPAYFSIPYPNGDVPADKGVCTDVIIRAYRKVNIDLQKKVHEDMKANFSKYPSQKKWGLKKTDTNIDHRRVYNLETFFTRNGTTKPITTKPEDYQPGDIVSWTLNNGLAHIGIVVDRKSKDGKRNLIVHNIGGGQVMEDCLFAWKIVGHYRYK
ncbi:hypothetical protein CLV62_10181 [Dysgonomonas alginatilytica]|uniref:DUF1287 domain-containing protein n=1 Tax=Dysgonomonas alginatilytica TaxID=1605892 RepID=A0A2V3PSW4_9BACT|nr:DUF1287 domain-containing protein [Dysgonomonas alginatilytica]PXV68817.1 hypothetical protein CLV62_10181 [Dysgonomonas alginatilytica]